MLLATAKIASVLLFKIGEGKLNEVVFQGNDYISKIILIKTNDGRESKNDFQSKKICECSIT